ncbi:MAG: SycD/LcrH family type III secretion system chaperone [Gammaproteobacteria bacterium]
MAESGKQLSVNEACEVLENLNEEQLEKVQQLALDSISSGLSRADIMGYSKESIEALYSVAYGLYQQGKDDEAKKTFQVLLMYEHSDPRFWLGLGGSCQRLGDYQEAVMAYGCGALGDLANPVFPFHAAESYISLQDWENAKQTLDTLIKLRAEKLIEGDHAEMYERVRAMADLVDEQLAATKS